MKKIFGLIIIMALMFSCNPPEVGYISDTIHAQSPIVTVPRGIYTLGTLPVVDGSTYPIKWSIASVTDKDGNVTDELTKTTDLLIWLKSFDPRTDTTWDLAMQKVQESQQPAMIISENSGQLSFTQNTKRVYGNDFYVNLTAKNVKGERIINNYIHVKFSPFKPVEFMVNTRLCIQFSKDGSNWEFDTGLTAPAKVTSMPNPSDYQLTPTDLDAQAKVLDGSHDKITILKKNAEPANSIKMKMVVTDSNGTPINPNKFSFYPNPTYPKDPGINLPSYHDNTIGVEVDSEGTTFALPSPPLPQYSVRYTNPTDPNRFLMYYLLLDAINFDRAAYEAANPAPSGGWPAFWALYTDPATGKIRTRVYMRWGILLNDTGTWEIKMKIPYCTAK